MEVVGAVASLVSAFADCAKLTKNLFKLHSNLSVLHQKVMVLKDLKQHVDSKLEAADKDGNLPTPQVKEWLRQVQEIMVVADSMTQPHSSSTISSCFFNCGLSLKLSKTLKKIDRLMGAGCYPDQRVAINHQAQPVEYIPTTPIQDQTVTTMSHNLARVMGLLGCDEVSRIGVWGMGGVGKTTLVKNLNNKLKSHGSAQVQPPHGMVIWATVSKDYIRKRVQTQIAERLSLKVGESDEDRMAIRLHQRLQKEDKFLLILDDVWQAIDLDLLGIPQPQVHAGAKIILTSRSLRVCIQMMTDEQVKVDVMDGNESWRLFSSTVGSVASLESIRPVAEQVVKHCSGLPLAITIVGAAMRGKESISLWNDALSELQRSVPLMEDMEEEVFKPLKWSYDRLQGKGIKSCFLYCCLYPEDFSIKISELVQCWVGEGLIREELDHERSINRGNALIQNLKDACLLESGDHDMTVKMHDVVRDVAVWIASSGEDGCKSLVRAGIGLTQVPEATFTNSLKRVSFMNNNIRSLPDCECSEASTLFLQGNKDLEFISEEFLQGFPALRVLNIGGTRISTLPCKVMQLSNLRALVLRGCSNLRELPASGWETLRTIQVLDLSQTDVRALPKGMENLSKLRELYLLSTRGLETIPAGVFSMLSSLEILEMQGSKYVWRIGADTEADLEELECLKRLATLSIRLDRETALSLRVNLTWIRRLVSFQLNIGEPACCKVKKGIVIDSVSNVSRGERLEHLLSSSNATYLKLDSCGGLNHMLQTSNACFSALKSLYIVNSNFSGTISGCRYDAKMDLLPNLEHLHLRRLSQLESVSGFATLLGLRLRRLTSLHIEECVEMKYLLSLGHGIILESLQEISVSSCIDLEAVFQHAPDAGAGAEEVVPNLETIRFFFLPELRTVLKSNQRQTWTSVERIEVNFCDQLRKLPLSSQNHTLKEIVGDQLWWNQLEWEDPCTKDSLHHLFKPYLCPFRLSSSQVRLLPCDFKSLAQARKSKLAAHMR